MIYFAAGAETWKRVDVGVRCAYAVSSRGRVKRCAGYRCRADKVLKCWKTADGYRQFDVYAEGGKRRVVRVHCLVAQAFIPNPQRKPFVNHKNRTPGDDRVENLEWVTHAENIKHGMAGYRRATSRPAHAGGSKPGAANGMSKLTEAAVREIRRSTLSCGALSRRYGVSAVQIGKIKRRLSWKEVPE